MTIDQTQFQNLLKKVAELKSSGQIDLSTEEDLSIAVMNLISLEEHFYFSGMKTEKGEYFDLLGEVRESRKTLLARLINKHEGETWCISKHLLAATMRLIEVGTKLQADGKKDEAAETFEHGYKIYNLFWALRLKLIDTGGFKKLAAEEKPLLREDASEGKAWTLKDIVNKLVDCCDERNADQRGLDANLRRKIK